MSCHIEQIEFAGVKTNVFWCSTEPDPELQVCAFCPSAGELLCDWPMMKQVELPTQEATVGDVWITQKKGTRARIVTIEAFDIHGQPTEGEYLARRFWVKIPGHPEPYPYLRQNGSTFTTERPGTCDAPMCHLHAREVGEDLHYCQTHWRAWEEVA